MSQERRKPMEDKDELPAANRPMRCLLVDDAPENVFLLSRILDRLGFCVGIARNGAEALDQVASEEPDFILMDMEMPVLDGFEATRRLRLLGFHKPIIAMTAHSLSEDSILGCGCDAHLSKPVNFPLLMNTIFTCTRKSDEGEG